MSVASAESIAFTKNIVFTQKELLFVKRKLHYYI